MLPTDAHCAIGHSRAPETDILDNSNKQSVGDSNNIFNQHADLSENHATLHISSKEPSSGLTTSSIRSNTKSNARTTTGSKRSLQQSLKISVDLINDILKREDTIVLHLESSKTASVFQSISKILNEIMVQLKFVAAVLALEVELGRDIENIEKLRKEHGGSQPLLTGLIKQDTICDVTLEFALSFLVHNLLSELLGLCHPFFEQKQVARKQDITEDLQILLGKLQTVVVYIPDAVCYNKEDIFSLDKSGSYWSELLKLVEFKEVAPSAQVIKSFKKFCKNIMLANAMMSKSHEITNETKRTLAMASVAVYYFFMEQQAVKQANLFYAQADSKSAFKVWNLLESKWVKEMMKMTLPPIKGHIKIMISRAAPSLTLEKIKEQLKRGTLNTITSGWLNVGNDRSRQELLQCARKNRKKEELLTKGSEKIMLRVLSHKPVPEVISCPLGQIPKPRSSGFFKQLVGSAYDPSDPSYDGLVFHIHGGGFVAMSSASHQSYTRQWANLIKKPIFSVDYRLAPSFPYPAALDDCWQAYNWLLEHCEDVLGIKSSKIIVTGDSAGGNLALALTILTIKSGVRAPDGLMLSYPALNLDSVKFSPSYLLAIEDQLLAYSFLRHCVAAYIPEGADPKNDPLLSPIKASDEMYKRLPPTRVLVGSNDPLHDESWRFIDKAKNVKLVVYKEFPHGFLNFDAPQGMEEAKETVRDSAAILLELFDLSFLLCKGKN